MRKTVIIVPHSFSPISAFHRISRSHIPTLRFKSHESLQINKSNFLTFDNVFM